MEGWPVRGKLKISLAAGGKQPKIRRFLAENEGAGGVCRRQVGEKCAFWLKTRVPERGKELYQKAKNTFPNSQITVPKQEYHVSNPLFWDLLYLKWQK